MDVTLRPGTEHDAGVAGRICYEAFRSIAEAHNFRPDFPSTVVTEEMLRIFLTHPMIYSVVAELDGVVAGSNFLDERAVITAVGPITVSPDVQDRRIGRALMEDVLRRAADRDAAGIRLLQAAYHSRSLALYAKLGFQPRDTLACMQGDPIGTVVEGYEVRAALADDLAACNDLCRAIHGHDRGVELAEAVDRGSARVVEHAGRITGYATGTAFFAHAVGESNQELKALLGASPALEGPGVLVPVRNAALFTWCLSHGLRVTQLATLMTIGLYNEPAGAWMPSIEF
jgi:predicted N-acetyltransferase YhbS